MDDIDVSREVLERTRGDDEFWENISEHNLLAAEFVANECNEVISPPYHSVWTIGQDRADYKWNHSAEEEERALQEMIPAAIAGIARSCIASLPNTAYYYTHQRYGVYEALTYCRRRLRLLRRILSAVIRSRERLRSSSAPAIGPAANAPAPPPPAGKAAPVLLPIPDPSRDAFKSIIADITEKNLPVNLMRLPEVLHEAVRAAGSLISMDEPKLNHLENLLLHYTPQDDGQKRTVLSTLLWLSIGKGSLKGVLSAVETLLSWQAQETLSSSSLSTIRSLKAYRQHFDLPSPTDLSFLGVWRYHSVAPQSKKKGYVSSSFAACAADGSYLYIINKEGLLKIGTGFGGTVPSFIYGHVADYRSMEKGWLAYNRGRLLYRSTGMGVGKAVVINTSTLLEEREVRLTHASGVFPPNYLATVSTTPEPTKATTWAELRESLLAEEPVLAMPSGTVPAPPTPSSSSSATPSAPGANVVLVGDGQHFYLISETIVEEKAPLPPAPPLEEKKEPPKDASGTPKKEEPKKPAATAALVKPPIIKKYFYRVAKYSDENTLVSVVELQPPSVAPRHDQIFCDGCQRASFTELRYKCSVCSDYNLCQPCYIRGVTSRAHKHTHHIAPTPQPDKDAPASPTLTADALIKGMYYTNGAVLAVILAPGQSPNPLRRKYCCRLFSLTDGAHITDVCVENALNIMAICFDPVNELLWANSPENWSVARWAHHGTQASKIHPEGGDTAESGALSLLDAVQSLSSKVSPCRRSRIASWAPFALDLTRETFEELSTLIRLTALKLEELANSNVAAMEASTAYRTMTHLLNLLRSNLYHAVRITEGNVLADMSSVLLAIKQQLLALQLSVPVLVPQVREVLLGGMKAFYPTPALQVLWAMDLVRQVADTGSASSSALLGRLFHKFAENANLGAHFWPANASEESSVLGDAVPLGALISHNFRSLAMLSAVAPSEVGQENVLSWDSKQVQQWIGTRRYRQFLSTEFFAPLDGRGLLGVTERHLPAAFKRETPKDAQTGLLTDISLLRQLTPAFVPDLHTLPMSAELRLLVNLQRDLLSRVSLSQSATVAATIRFLTYARVVIDRSTVFLSSLLTPSTPSLTALETPSVLSVLLPVLLLELHLMANNIELAAQLHPMASSFSATLELVHHRFPRFFDTSSPSSMPALVELHSITSQLLASILTTLYQGETLQSAEISHRQMFSSALFASPSGLLPDPTNEQTKVAKELLEQGENASNAPVANLSRWLRKSTARLAPVPASAEPFVHQSERAFFAACLWIQSLLPTALEFATRVSTEPQFTPPDAVASLLQSAVRFRIWCTNTVRNAEEKSGKIKPTDESLSAQLRSLAECLLAIPPPASAPPVALVESFLNSLLTPAAVAAVLQARTRRCETRALALSVFADLFERSSCPSLCVEALRTLAPVARGRLQHFLFEDVIGCPPTAVSSLRQAFNRAFVMLVGTLEDAKDTLPAVTRSSNDGAVPVQNRCPTGHMMSFADGRPYRCDLCSTSHPDAPHWWCPPCDYDCCHSCLPPPTHGAGNALSIASGDDDIYVRRLLALNFVAQYYTPETVDPKFLSQLLTSLWRISYGEQKGTYPGKIEAAARVLFTTLASVVLHWQQNSAPVSLVLSLIMSYLRSYTERTESGFLDDEDTLDLFSLLYRHRSVAAVLALLFNGKDADLLWALVQHGTPRLARLALRCYQYGFSRPVVGDTVVRSVFARLFALLGSALLDNMPAALSTSTSVLPAVTGAADAQAPHVVIVAPMPGVPTQDFVKIFARASLPKTRARDVAQEATDVGQAVVISGTQAECTDAATKLAPLGFSCCVVPLLTPPTATAVHKSPLRAPQISAALASELIAVLRALGRTEQGQQVVQTYVQKSLEAMPLLLVADPPKHLLASAIAALALCGGFAEPLRIGGTVRTAVGQEGYVMELNGSSARVMVKQGEERALENADTVRIIAVSAVPALLLPTPPSLVSAIEPLLANASSPNALRHVSSLGTAFLVALRETSMSAPKVFETFSALVSSLVRFSDATSMTPTAVAKLAPTPVRILPHALPCNNPAELPVGWNASRSMQCVFTGADRCRVQYYGKDTEEGTVVADQCVPATAAEYYFEVTIETVAESKAMVHIGLCPAESAPGWGATTYEFLPSGKKASPAPRDNSAGNRVFTCPYCAQEDLTGRELCHHARQRHSNSSMSVVCPLCAASPFGDPAQVSSNFISHLPNRHNDMLQAPAVKRVEATYSDAYEKKDVIGCGYRRADGSIYFTRNGKFLMSAFIGIYGRLMPFVRLVGGGASLQANFGQSPFQCDVRKASSADVAQREKLKADAEAEKKKVREEAEAKIRAKQEMAKMLQSFVGFPLDFCMLALEQSNGNLETAASWALENIERHISGASVAQAPEGSESFSPTTSLTSSSTGSSVSSAQNSYHLELPYALEESELLVTPLMSNKAKVRHEEAQAGVLVSVVDSASSYFANWTEALLKKVNLAGTICAVDKIRLLALVRFEDEERGVQEEAWLPLRALVPLAHSPQPSQNLLRDKVASTTVALLLSLPTLPAPLFVERPSLCSFLALLCSTVFAGRSHAALMPQLRALLRSASAGSSATAAQLVTESTRLLTEAITVVKETSTVLESDHPSLAVETSHTVTFKVPATGYHVSFAKRTRLSPRDSLLLSALPAFERRVTFADNADQVAPYQPVSVLSSAPLRVRFLPRETQRQNLWGWRIRVCPLLPSLSIATWLLSDVLADCAEVQRVASTLEPLLLMTELPDFVRQKLFRIAISLGSAPSRTLGISASTASALITELSEQLENNKASISVFLQDFTELGLLLVRQAGGTSPPSLSPILTRLIRGEAALRWLNQLAPLPTFIEEQAAAEMQRCPFRPPAFPVIVDSGALTAAARTALVQVFLRFDADKDGTWNAEEMAAYCKTVSISVPEKEGHPDVTKFLAWQFREAQRDASSVWTNLWKLGFDALLQLHVEAPRPDNAPPIASLDKDLVTFTSRLAEHVGSPIRTLHPIHLLGSPLLASFQRLQPMARPLRDRFQHLKFADEAVFSLVPYINLSPELLGTRSWASLLSAVRSSLFYESKMRFIATVLGASASNSEPPTVRIDRINDRTPVFTQLFTQLSGALSASLRQKQRAFKVVLKNERVEGEVGPYREVFSQLCTELQSGALPLLIPCPNRQQAVQTVGVGENRDKFILCPSLSSSSHLAMLQFLGQLLGIALRTSNPLSLDLPSFFWKPLVGSALTRHDLEQVDFSVCKSWAAIETMSKEDFEAAVFETFSVALSDGKAVALLDKGDTPVDYASRKDFLRLAEIARLTESATQIVAVRRGLASLIPASVFLLLEWNDVALRVCGHGELDLDLLKRHTQYRAGLSNTDPEVIWFWEVLEEFTNEERRLFLRFAWGRERLPPEEELAREEMKLFPLITDGDSDEPLPTAETCFFNVKLPHYTSIDVLREKLHYAILHTRTIDGDLEHSV